MVRIHLQFDQEIPQYVCSPCSNCHSTFGRSLCSIKNRGCCWYYPKFTLHEIHKMAKSKEGMEILNSIMELPDTKVYNYYLHAKGYFDEAGYKKYLESGQAYLDEIEDKTIFFRVCPFVKPGTGCSLPVKYRSFICNFFICSEVNELVADNDIFKDYIKEQNSYVKWIKWENQSLESLLKEKDLSLLSNFDEVISLLKDIPLEPYEFPDLPAVESFSGYSIGA